MSRASATLTGFGAVLLWSLLALFTVGSAPVPPLLLNALTFGLGGLVGLVWLLLSGGFGQLAGVRPVVFLWGAIGLFGYHALYFSALRLAPPAEAGLISYLWPLLIVLFSAFLPGERLTLLHLSGALVAFAGTAALVLGAGVTPSAGAIAGYGLAFAAALTWTAYSVMSRRIDGVPTGSVAVFCLATALLSVPAHLMLEETVWPRSMASWLSVLALGLGPVGLAFYVWDVGVKQGDIQLLGVASYAAPLLSTFALVVTGYAAWTPRIGVAAALITAGAALAALASARAGRKKVSCDSAG
jgi:drug/metabolite transporter (DMT)-like permease